MTSWVIFATEQPDLAAKVRARLEAHKHHVLATLRPDGSPRVSGTEVAWVGDELTMGSMGGALKARDLGRDPRFALHANPGDGSLQGGDAKLSGTVREGGEAEGHEGSHLFICSLEQVVLTELDPQERFLLISSWRPGQGLVRHERT